MLMNLLNYKMKKILLLLILLSFATYAQKIRPFIGVSGYVHAGFEKSGFGDLKIGAEYKIFYYLKPEIEISYMLGNPEGFTDYDETGLAISEYSQKTSAFNYSFCPKIILGNKDDGDGYIQILPKYTYSNIQASGHRFSRNPVEPSKPFEEKKKVSSSEHSFGIGLGYVVDFSDENSQSIALNIYLNNVDLGKALNKLETNKRFNTEYVIGFGVNYYFSFKKKTI